MNLLFPSLALILLVFLPIASADTGIGDCAELQAMNASLSGDFFLENDIDCSGVDFTPIGAGFPDDAFDGTFEGNGYTISNLIIYQPDAENVGLFGYVVTPAVIQNVIIRDFNVTGSETVGGLIGTIEETGLISNVSMVDGYVLADISSGYIAGGLIGSSYDAVIVNCSVIGVSVVALGDYAGGLIGYSSTDEVSNSYAYADVSGNDYVGGLFGTIESGTNVNQSYSNGTVNGVNYVGGFSAYGNFFGTVSDSYSHSAVNGSDSVGGFMGWNRNGTIINSYSAGNVSGSTNVGGFIGANDDTCTDSFWDNETSGQVSSDCGTGETTAKMKTEAIFTGAGWDFSAGGVWTIDEGITYPCLQYEYGGLTCTASIPAMIPSAPTGIEATLNEAGSGLGSFLSLITSPLVSIILGLGLVGGILAIMFGLASAIKGAISGAVRN